MENTHDVNLLRKEIENTRRELHKLIHSENYNLTSQPTIELSNKLDVLLSNYITIIKEK